MPFKPALGISDFRKLREEGAGYVDKTDFIAQLLDESTQVVLFPRPRRFGKTINLSALRYFLEKRPEDLSHLFHDLAVWQHPGARAHFQRHPVVFLSFKDIRADTWESAFRAIRLALQDLFLEHREAITSAAIAPEEASELHKLLAGEATEEECQVSLKRLSSVLFRVHGEQVAILVDEYDTPIQSGFLCGFYDDAVRFFRNLFSAAPEYAKRPAAAQFIRRIRKEVRTTVASFTDSYQYTIDQLIEQILVRCREQSLRLTDTEAAAKIDFIVFLTVQTMNYLHSGRHRVAL